MSQIKLFTSNSEIFKEPKLGDYSVYIWCDRSEKQHMDLGWNIELEYNPIYVGKGKSFGNIIRWRSFAHKHDLLNSIIKLNPDKYVCYIVSIGITNDNSKVLESYIINKLIEKKYVFTKFKSMDLNIEKNQLVNKKKEKMYDFKKYLNF